MSLMSIDDRTFPEWKFDNYEASMEKARAIEEAFRANGGKSPTGLNERTALYEIACRLHGTPKGGHAVDLGTNHGVSAATIAAGLNGKGLVFTFDNYRYYAERDDDDIAHKRLFIVRKTFHQLNLHRDICQIICDDEIALSYFNLPVCLAYIDARHDYRSVSRHIELMSRLLMPGGFMVLHDYADEQWSGVIPAVNEFVDAQKDSIRCFRQRTSIYIQRVKDLKPYRGFCQ